MRTLQLAAMLSRMRFPRQVASAFLLLLTTWACGQDAVGAARKWQSTHRAQILEEFQTLLAIPNIASDTANIRRNADALVAMLQKRGVSTRLLENPKAPPVVFGAIDTPGAK